MKSFDRQWRKLTALARSAPADAGVAAPYGFATRVAAQAAALPAAPWLALERLALRGFLAATACSVAAVVFNYATLPSVPADDEAGGDTVSEVLDLT